MSLCPSNLIAQNDNPQSKVFPNLARRVNGLSETEKESVFHHVDNSCRMELQRAGIKTYEIEALRNHRSEVPTKVRGDHCMWGFQRAWYYWVAEGPGIPPAVAEEFHQQWGTQCRVEGHCGCPSPSEYMRGFAVGLYHIDTQEGLNAFAKLLGTIYVATT